MKANEFVRAIGLSDARRVLSGNDGARYFGCTIEMAKYWVSSSNEYHISEIFFPNMSNQFALNLDELKRLIESHELVEKMGRLEKSKAILNRSPSNAESYQDGYYFRTKPEFLFHNGFHHWNMTTNNGQWFKDLGFNPVLIVDLKQAIADVESCQ